MLYRKVHKQSEQLSYQLLEDWFVSFWWMEKSTTGVLVHSVEDHPINENKQWLKNSTPQKKGKKTNYICKYQCIPTIVILPASLLIWDFDLNLDEGVDKCRISLSRLLRGVRSLDRLESYHQQRLNYSPLTNMLRYNTVHDAQLSTKVLPSLPLWNLNSWKPLL